MADVRMIGDSSAGWKGIVRGKEVEYPRLPVNVIATFHVGQPGQLYTLGIS